MEQEQQNETTEALRAKVRGHIERMFPEAEAELGFASATNAARQEGGYDAARRIVARDQLVERISACMVDPTTMGFRHVGLRPEHARILRANNFSLYVKRGGKRPEGAK